jgi:lipopolysaccharide export system protein LptA
MTHGRNATRKAAFGAGMIVALTLGAGAAQAQLSSQKGPIDITGDHMEVLDQQHLITWKGRVEALQGETRMRSDLLNIYYKAAAKTSGAPKAQAGAPGADFGDIDHMEAVGDVYFVTPTEVARGDKAVYTADNDQVVITGNVVLTRGEDVGRGTRLVIDLNTNHATLEGGPTGRPRVIVYPKQKPQGQSR